VAAIARDNHASRDRHSDPRFSWPPPPLPTPTVPCATAFATGPRVRCRRSSASGAPSPLARPSREHHRRSFLVERRRRSLASGRTAARRSHGRGNHLLSAFRDRGVPKPMSECRRVPQPRWVNARPSAKGGSEAAGDRRERGGNPVAFVFVPRPGRVRLQ
jgi:hypothetical protein